MTAATCPYCETPLQTSDSAYCRYCGMDWQDPRHAFRHSIDTSTYAERAAKAVRLYLRGAFGPSEMWHQLVDLTTPGNVEQLMKAVPPNLHGSLSCLLENQPLDLENGGLSAIRRWFAHKNGNQSVES